MKTRSKQKILERFADSAPIAEILASAPTLDNNIVVSNLKGGSSSALASLLAERAGRPILLITSTLERAESLADGVAFFGGDALLMPAFETLPFETTEPVLHIAACRARALSTLARLDAESTPLIIAPADALMNRVLPRERLAEQCIRFEWGEAIDVDSLAEQLIDLGYRRESMAESPGEFAIRGTIVDIFPAESEYPARLDLFGDEIESIRTFDPATQRSLKSDAEIESVEILARAQIEPALNHLEAGKELISFFDLLPERTLVVLDGPARIEQRLEYFDSVVERHHQDTLDHAPEEDEQPNFFLANEIGPARWVMESSDALAAIRKFGRIEWVELTVEADRGGPDRATDARMISVGAHGFESFKPNFKDFLELIIEKQKGEFQIAVVCDNLGQAERMDELFRENSVSAVIVEAEAHAGGETIKPAGHDVVLMTGELHEGFIYSAARQLVLTDREIFGRYKRRRIYRKAHHGKAVVSATEISRGDFVVHFEHGIGRFDRMRRLELDHRTTEFIEIVYHGDDKLLLPIEKLHLIQKYSSSDAREPTLDKLGKKMWAKRTKKTQEVVRKLAGELLDLYARREAAERPPLGPDTVWQNEFEASFVYQETPDQIKAINEVKKDLTNPRPTDRLICGDVGYGKTEVAIRAAFKMLVEGRQVAVLVPTTILCQQHFNTFTERLADYPFRVDMLSRFRSAAEQKKTIAAIEAGEVHLVVGTHRLLSKDIKFSNLGLLVVDEEQRFGVKQKEKIKSLRTAVDILTLTATPIPRTLHMALSKLRDLSIISTPPADRHPIRTRTIHFDKDHIEEAILRELNRGGQVFFVHNRIASIDDVARTVGEIVPGARIAVAHGQMDERTLEKIMMDFIAREYDVLLSTTIIENGLDIPNVNTIIINRADAFGLSQLYQLRGRVGRDVRQAYAYLIVPRGRAITDAAMKRLTALEEFTDLGMGFTIAMRDMEIRGTGNILGQEQSGAIADVGFDLYCKLLEEAVMELRGEPVAEPLHPVEIKWPVDQWLPEAFIPVETQRIRFYRELASAREADRLDMIEDELVDCYGPLPDEALQMLAAFRIKHALSPWRVDKVSSGATGPIRVAGGTNAKPLAQALASLTSDAEWANKVTMRGDGTITLHLVDDDAKRGELLVELAGVLIHLPGPGIARELEPAAR